MKRQFRVDGLSLLDAAHILEAEDVFTREHQEVSARLQESKMC